MQTYFLLLTFFLHFRGGKDQKQRSTISTIYQFHILKEEQAKKGVVLANIFSTLHLFFLHFRGGKDKKRRSSQDILFPLCTNLRGGAGHSSRIGLGAN